MSRSSWVAVPLAVVAAASSLSAQWVSVPLAASPPARFGAVLTPWQDGELLLFGGDAGVATATEWSWNGIRWTPVTTPVPRRNSPALARHDGNGSLLLFGGQTNTGSQLADTWQFAAGSWTQLSPGTTPGGTPLAMGFEPDAQAMVLVTQSAPFTFATWRFTAGDWSQINQFSLTSALPFALFHDSVRRELCMVASGVPGISVHRLVGATWMQVDQVPATPAPTWAMFDSDRGRAVIVHSRLPAVFETYVYDGLRIVPRPVQAIPYVPPGAGGLAWHAERHEPVFVGATLTAMELWRWNEAPVPMATAYGTPCVSAAFQLAVAPGDSPQPGAVHRLRAAGSNATALTLSVLGLSHVQNAGLPLPQTIPLGALGCQLRVEALLTDFVGVGLPATRVVAVPVTPSLLGARYDAQFVQFDAAGVTDASNGLEVQIGLPLPENVLLETFASAQHRDARASGDAWGNGVVAPVAIGGDGRHGSFDATLGTSLGGGVYEWNTDNTTIPANVTLSSQAETVTDGRFSFTDFVVPAGITVRFVGSAPAQLFVRGLVDVQGTVSIDAADMPAYVPTTGPLAGQRVSNFNARGSPASLNVLGQPGGSAGAGGGRGGDGGRECQGTGPIFSGGVNITDGQRGQDVRVLAGHAYAAATPGTGGAGSPMNPASGLTSAAGAPFIIATLTYRDEFSRGGGGGGFMLPGGVPALPTIPPYVGQPSPTQPNNGPAVAGGVAFPLSPFPANPPSGYSSLQHYLIGGSGGGGGGSHPFAIATALALEAFMAGHGGSGGGGAIALRAGGDVTIPGTISARGGRGVVINGDRPSSAFPDVDFGVSSPGGGGSGGSVVAQSARSVTVNGTIDTSGGDGSRTSNVAIQSLAPFQLNVQSQAGAGSSGFYRLEAAGSVAFTGSGVPAFAPATQSGVLADVDARTGSRSTWLLPPAAGLPYYLRYELLIDVAGVPLLLSDDPAISPLAASNPTGPVLLRVQGARLDPLTGGPAAGSLGPWRTQLRPGSDSVNQDRATLLRFDLVLDKTQGPVQVRELRLVWR